jgi:hypothetical protein
MSGKKQNNVVPTALLGIIGEIFYQNAVPSGTTRDDIIVENITYGK